MVSQQRGGEGMSFSPPKGEVGIFEQRSQVCQDRLNQLYARFGLDDLRVLPDPNVDSNFVELSKQKGTREWLALKLKTLEGMIAEASYGNERILFVLEKSLSEWEKYDASMIEPDITPRETSGGGSQLAA